VAAVLSGGPKSPAATGQLSRRAWASLHRHDERMVPRLALGPSLRRAGRLTRDPPRCAALASGKNVTTSTDASDEFLGGGKEKAEYQSIDKVHR
jgi:hypothetical protein